MGLYYKAIIGDEMGENREVYKPYVLLPNGEEKLMGYKMEEHMSITNPFMDGFSHVLEDSPKRVIWAVDADFILGEADKETGLHPLVSKRLYRGAPVSLPTYEEAWGGKEQKAESHAVHPYDFMYEYVWLVNYDKKIYLDMYKYINKHMKEYDRGGYKEIYCPSPVPLLTCQDKACGYENVTDDTILYTGAWAWDLISFASSIPKGFKEVEW